MGAFTIKGTKACNCQMQCDIIPCLFWKTSLCILCIQIIISFFNHIYLLVILTSHIFKVISLSFGNPFMHINYLKCCRQIMFLDLKVLFVYQVYTTHSRNLKGDSYWLFKVQKELRLIKNHICYKYLHIWFKRAFGLVNYKFWWCILNKSCSFLYGVWPVISKKIEL
jgi:hypothetical protein